MANDWTQKQLEKYSVNFDQSDKDGNGTLRFREVVHALVIGGFRGTYGEAKKIFKELDSNDDKAISKQEFLNCVRNLPNIDLKKMCMRREFQMLDSDNSGYLSKDELMDGIKNADLDVQAEKIADLLVHLVKEDKDKRVSYEEFIDVYGSKRG